jgi:hypothetical protein
MTDNVAVRLIEPFSYFPDHSSAILGLGGPNTGPDPNYCFHTHYHAYQPGLVILKVVLAGVQVSYGELAIRVHAHKPDSNLNISVVASARMPLDGLQSEKLEIALRISAIPGVLYALYGYFSEPSDLSATNLEIIAEEMIDGRENFVSAETRATPFDGGRFDFPNRLIADHPPSFRFPVSQPCTTGQIESIEFTENWSEFATNDSNTIARWSITFPLQVLKCYDFLHLGASGLLVDSRPTMIASFLADRGCAVRMLNSNEDGNSFSDGKLPLPSSSLGTEHGSSVDYPMYGLKEIGDGPEQFDFSISLGTINMLNSEVSMTGFVNAVIKHVLRRGIAIFMFDYATDALQRDALTRASGKRFLPNRDDIEKIAMRVIGHGCEVAQLSFPDGRDGNTVTGPITPFGLIVRR